MQLFASFVTRLAQHARGAAAVPQRRQRQQGQLEPVAPTYVDLSYHGLYGRATGVALTTAALAVGNQWPSAFEGEGGSDHGDGVAEPDGDSAALAALLQVIRAVTAALAALGLVTVSALPAALDQLHGVKKH